PGSTFKLVTLSAVLANHVAKPSDRFPVRTHAILDGVPLENANGESCGGTLVDSFANSCNSVFAPLGVKVGAQHLVQMAEAYGFNEPPPFPGALPSTIPAASRITAPLDIGSTAIGQGEVLATPLEMASIAQTIATQGVRYRPAIVPGPPPAPRRAVTPKVARTVRRMMIEVVRRGTGTSAALAPGEVAGKTGTAELGNTRGPGATSGGAQNTDAWFACFAPAKAPQIAVGVILIRAGAGGDTAAPVARQVLVAALGGR
ncbi:MAG: penicillin-binding protein 2, partial [Actinobacteria bacterium]|nr:penicillin-binding protein 2 [Actinomycetota bacterium]